MQEGTKDTLTEVSDKPQFLRFILIHYKKMLRKKRSRLKIKQHLFR